MVLYVPGTEETDPKKQNISLQAIGAAATTAIANVATNTTNIATNTTNIATNTTNIATNTTNIATNTASILALMPGYLFGLTLSTAGSSSAFGIALGAAADSSGVSLMSLASAYTKTTGAWAVGSANGGLDTGAIANSTWYHAFVIKRIDTGVADVLISLSPTAPTMPTNYTLRRRIGSMKTDGSAQWVKFTQLGDEFLWDSPVTDAAAITLTTTATTQTVSTPTGIQNQALIGGLLNPSGTGIFFTISALDSADVLPSTASFSGFVSGNGVAAISIAMSVRTSTANQIRLRASASASSTYVSTRGWIDNRGRLS